MGPREHQRLTKSRSVATERFSVGKLLGFGSNDGSARINSLQVDAPCILMYTLTHDNLHVYDLKKNEVSISCTGLH